MGMYLEVEDQSALEVQQGGGFSIVNIQLMKTLLQRGIYMVPLFTLNACKQLCKNAI